MARLLIPCCILICLCRFAQAQIAYVDSLEQSLEEAQDDSMRIKLLREHISAYLWADDSNAVERYRQLYELARKNKDKVGMIYGRYYQAIELIDSGKFTAAIELFKGMIHSLDSLNVIQNLNGPLADIRIIYNRSGLQKERFEFYSEKLQYYKEHGPGENAAVCYHGLGGYYLTLRDYEKTIEYFLRSREIFKSFSYGDYLNETLVIGWRYLEWGNPEKAEEYLQEALIGMRKIHDLESEVSALTQLGRLQLIKSNYPAALGYFYEVKSHWTDLPNLQVVINVLDLSGTYLQLNKPDSVLYYLEIANNIRSKKKFEFNSLLGPVEIDFYNYLYFATLKNDVRALSYLQAALQEAEAANFRPMVLKYCGELAGFYLARNDTASAFVYLHRTQLLNDSIEAEGKRSRIASYELDIQQRQKESQIKELENQKVRQRNYYMIGGLFLLIIIGGAFSRMRTINRTKKLLEEKNRQIALEKEIAEKQRQRAEQSEKFKQQFLANVSHEIRTPMNAVVGMTNLLLKKNPRIDQQSYLTGIHNSGETLIHLINDILDFSRIEAGKIEIEKIDFSFREVVDQVYHTLKFRAEEKGIQLCTSVDESIHDVLLGDPVRLTQVLINLVGNAVKFTERGSVLIKIENATLKEVELRQTQSSFALLLFSITDTGIGISAEKVSSIFESFTQAHSSDSRKYGGTGLGLSISKQLIELMGGHLQVDSEPEKGSKFYFTLDFEIGDESRLRLRKRTEQDVDGSILTGLRILLAEDNEYNRIVVTDTLKSVADVEIEYSANGRELLKKLSLLSESPGPNYDVILMDVQMPEMDGYEATREIRRLKGTLKDTPIVALTASVLRTDLERCREAGMNDYIPKPFKISQLITIIAKVTGRIQTYDETSDHQKLQEAENSFSHKSSIGSLVDLSSLSEFCKGDSLKMEKYITLFTESVPSFVENLNVARSENNCEKMRDLIHAMKPKMIMLGIPHAKSILNDIESMLLDNTDLSKLDEHISTLISLCEDSAEDLKNWEDQENS